MDAKLDQAKKFADAVNALDSGKVANAKVWQRDSRVRVYLTFPRWVNGSAGGGEMGHVDFSGSEIRWATRIDSETLAQLKAVL